MAKTYSHVVVTRLGLGISSDAWFRRRFSIFRHVCFPSLAAQTQQPDRWIVSCDIRAPKWLDSEFDALRKILPLIELRRIDPFINSTLNPLPKTYLREIAEHDQVLTSRIDDDDCWRRDVVERTQQLATAASQYTARAGITFYHGLEYNVSRGSLQTMTYPWHSMAVNVLSPLKQLITCYDFSHTRATLRLRELNYTLVEYGDSRPSWLYLRHAAADSAYKGMKATGATLAIDSAQESKARTEFNVELPAIGKLLAGDIDLPGVDLTHPYIEEIARTRRAGRLTQLEAKQELLKIERQLRQSGDTERADEVVRLFYGEQANSPGRVTDRGVANG